VPDALARDDSTPYPFRYRVQVSLMPPSLERSSRSDLLLGFGSQHGSGSTLNWRPPTRAGGASPLAARTIRRCRTVLSVAPTLSQRQLRLSPTFDRPPQTAI
jgi:hypothetical protein